MSDPDSEPVRPGILITRPEGGASATARRVAALGFSPVIAPVLVIAPRTLAETVAPQAVLITSGNAIPALPGRWHGVKLLAVGDATAARARAAGFSQVFSASGDETALAALVTRHCTPIAGTLLLACGQGQCQRLATTLRRRGFRVTRRIAYAATPVAALPEAARAALQGEALRAVLFFSTASAHAFVHLLPAALAGQVAGLDALAISAGAAAALAPLPWRRIRVASRPNQDELLALLP